MIWMATSSNHSHKKTLHPHCRAKGQMTALRSCPATCTFSRTTHKMGWRQSSFQEPSIIAYLLSPATVPSMSHVCHLRHYSPWPTISFLHFSCSPYFHLETSNQTAKVQNKCQLSQETIQNFPLYFHVISYCLCTWYLYVSVTSILF